MKTRILGNGNSCYHVFSRINERRFLLGPNEKNVFRDMMWRVAAFSGVRILTYCIMSNHFHILVEIPEREEIGDAELMRRLRLIYKGQAWLNVQWEFDRCGDNDEWREAVREKYLHRMYDLSEFMRSLKLRYSFWFNRNHDREGTLWDARFKSVLVEGPKFGEDLGSGNLALATVAAYIDLNAVRAEIVEDPKDYCWCGYAEAVAGERRSRQGFSYIYGVREGRQRAWQEIHRFYQEMLFAKTGSEQHGDAVKLLSRSRVRSFTAGAVLGSRDFVDSVFRSNRSFFSDRRISGARIIQGGGRHGLYAARSVGVV